MSADISARGLRWLLQPVEQVEFLNSYWERQPLHVKRADPAYYACLPDRRDIDGLVTTAAFGNGTGKAEGRLVRTGRDGKLSERTFRPREDGSPDIHEIYRSYDEGYTVVLNQIHMRSPVVGALCREVEADLQHPVGANLYLTPRRAQGFLPHVDSHDVIVVQVQGVKEWRVGAAASRPFLTPALPRQPIDAVPDAQSYLLDPGDALYIPRGHAHEAVTQTSSSLHLTIGIHVFTWVDVLVEALRRVAIEDADLRRALPIGHLGTGFDDSLVTAIAQRIAPMTEPSTLDAARLALGTRLLARQAATTGHFASLDAVPHLTVHSTVTRGFQGACRVRSVDGRAVVDYPGNYLSVPPFLAAALEHAAATHTFAVETIPGDLSAEEKVEFAARLVSEGFLAVVDHEGATRP